MFANICRSWPVHALYACILLYALHRIMVVCMHIIVCIASHYGCMHAYYCKHYIALWLYACILLYALHRIMNMQAITISAFHDFGLLLDLLPA